MTKANPEGEWEENLWFDTLLGGNIFWSETTAYTKSCFYCPDEKKKGQEAWYRIQIVKQLMVVGGNTEITQNTMPQAELARLRAKSALTVMGLEVLT